jgi:hypothetical protein
VKKDNAVWARYINARRKKEEDRRKEEDRKRTVEEARRKVIVMAPMSDVGQSSNHIRTWRK